MPSAAELGDAFYSGSLFGRTPDTQSAFYGRAAAFINKKNPRGINSRGTVGAVRVPVNNTQTFNQDAYDRATKAGYSNNDINAFLKESGVRAEGSMFGVAGTGTYGGKESAYWQVTPAYKPPTPKAESKVTTAPDTSNEVLQTLKLPNNGLGTIEEVKPLPPAISAPAPILGDPLGQSSQRVSRAKARLSIAK